MGGHGIIHDRFPPPLIFLSPHSDIPHQYHFKKKLSHQIQSNFLILQYDSILITQYVPKLVIFVNFW